MHHAEEPRTRSVTRSSVKRFIGRKFSEVEAEVKEIQYRIKPGESGNVKIECLQTGKAYAPEELSAEARLSMCTCVMRAPHFADG
jgi:molecular chaperone DnaK (HSP70)